MTLLLLVGGAFSSSAGAANDLTLTVVPSPVTSASAWTTVVTAQAPVVNAGVAQQEIIQAFDPSRFELSSLTDGVVYPFGWTPTYSSDGITFGPAPTTAEGWDAIRAVKASGPVDSQGSYNGRQIATGSATQVTPPGGSFTSGGGNSGDGWDVFFDDRNHVFNVFHHENWPDGAIDCHMRNGDPCGPGWPFRIYGTTSFKSTGVVDNTYDQLWLSTSTPSYGTPTPSPTSRTGFLCIDISNLATGPRFCRSGASAMASFTASFLPMWPAPQNNYYNAGPPRMIGSRAFAIAANSTAGHRLMCLDMTANGGFGAACPGSPVSVPSLGDERVSVIKVSGGRLYIGSPTTATCVMPDTLQACPGWSAAKTYSLGGLDHSPVIYEQPNASGVVEGVCFTNPQTTHTACYKPDGTTLTPLSGLTSFMVTASAAVWYPRNPDTVGTRVYWSNHAGLSAGGALKCYDVATLATCPGWPLAQSSYTLTVDPYNPDCLWRNHDDGVIRAYSSSGTLGCNTPPRWVDLNAESVVPRMACSAEGAVREWRSFTLTAPLTGYTGATLSVLRDGVPVVSNGVTWSNVPLTAAVAQDLQTLLVADSGPNPTFRVALAGRTTWADISAQITAVGDAPELCLRLAAETTCPAPTAQIPVGTQLGWSSVVSTTGSASLSGGGGSVTFTPDSESVPVTILDTECLGTISGTTTVLTTVGTAAGTAAVGVPVYLKDANGNIIATTTTDGSGNYEFPRLAAGTGYRVEFGQSAGYTPSTTTTSSATTNRTVVANQVTDVDGTYVTRLSAPNRVEAILPTETAVFDPFTVDGDSPAATPTTNQSFTAARKALTRICDSTQNGTTVPCSATSLTIPGQGTWTVNTNSASPDVGKITFTPFAGFTGTATPMTYQVTDTSGAKAAGTLTPIVPPPPVLNPDVNTDAWDVTQTINPLTNDAATAAGATLNPATVRLCVTGTPVASCTGTTLTINGQGTYTLNTATGTVSFDPLPTFTGTATPIAYVVADSNGLTVMSTITPTVLPPPLDSPNPDTSTGPMGQAQTVNPLTNDVTPSGVTLTASSVRLCGATEVAPACTQTSATVDGQGTYTVNQTTGEITFTPLSTFSGTASGIPYGVVDSVGRAITSTYTPTVVPLPTATPNTSLGAWDQVQTITPLDNDTAATGAVLDPTSVRLCTTGTPAASCTGTTLTTAQGTYTVDTATGVVTFDPVPGFTGVAPAIAYVVADSLGQKVTSTITPEVTPPPPPVATPETKQVIPGGTATFTTLTGTGGLATTSGPTFATASTCLVDTAPDPDTCGTIVVIADQGTYTLDPATGIVTFTALPGLAAGPLTAVTYRVTDVTGQTATSTLTPIIPPQPLATNDSSVAEKDKTQIISILSNDAAGSAGAPLVASTLRLCDPTTTPPQNGTTVPCTLTTLTVTDVGTYTILADGTVQFTPLATYTGVAPPVRYQVADALGQTTTAEIAVTVLPPPAVTAVPDAGSAGYGASVVFSPLANDSAGTIPAADGNPYTQVGTATLLASSVRLCGASESAPNCTLLSLVTPEGTYTVGAGGAITFAPAAGYVGTPVSPPRYMVCNAIGGTWTIADGADADTDPDVVVVAPSCATATVTPTIGPPAVPVAVNDTSTGAWDVTQTIAILANDTKDPQLTLVASTVFLCNPATTPPQVMPYCSATSVTTSEGTYSVVTDPSSPDYGKVLFDPLPTFRGTAQHPVAYQVKDSFGQTVTATITPTVSPPTAPTATPDTESLLPGTTVAFSAITGSGGLASGQSLQTSGSSVTCLLVPGTSTCDADGVVTIANQGTYTLNPATGIVTFTALPGLAAGPLTAVTYRVTDVTGQTATSALTPTIIGPPTATQNTSTGQHDTVQTIDILANDTAATGATLVPGSVRLCATIPSRQTPPNCTATQLVVDGEGTYTVNPDGTVSFDPLPSFIGAATAATYQVSDSLGQVASSLILPSVSAPNAPAATDDATSSPWNTPVTVNAVVNDTAGGTAIPLVPSTVALCSIDLGQTPPNCTATQLVIDGQGTYTVDPTTGAIGFTPEATFVGAATPIVYQIEDTLGQTTSARVSITITPLAPTATGDAATVPAGGTTTLTATMVPGTWPIDTSKTCLSTGTTCSPTDTMLVLPEGTYILNPLTGEVAFTAAPGFSGPAPNPPNVVFTDTSGQTVVAPIVVTVEPAPVPPAAPAPAPTPAPPSPLPPAALPDVESTGPDQPVTLPVLGNDSPGGTTGFVPSTLVLRDPATGRYQRTVTVPGEGVFTANPDGTITFTPEPGFTGATRTLVYRVNTVDGGTTTSTVQVNVRPGEPPWADPDHAQGPTNTPVVLDPLANDNAGRTPFDPATLRLRDPDTGKLVTTLTVPGEGTYVVDPATGRVTFTPIRDFAGTATPVRYRVLDGNGQSAESTLHITIHTRAPALRIRTTASRPILQVGQRTTISLRVTNPSRATATSTITRARIPTGFRVVDPMGGTVKGGYITFRTGDLRAGATTTRTFVLVATRTTATSGRPVNGDANGTNVNRVHDPTRLFVVAPPRPGTPAVTG